MVGAEPHLPYDRPPLSKEYLLGAIGVAELALADQADIDELDAQWHLGVAAERLDPAGVRVVPSSGLDITADGVVIATTSEERGGGRECRSRWSPFQSKKIIARSGSQ